MVMAMMLIAVAVAPAVDRTFDLGPPAGSAIEVLDQVLQGAQEPVISPVTEALDRQEQGEQLIATAAVQADTKSGLAAAVDTVIERRTETRARSGTLLSGGADVQARARSGTFGAPH
jgi:hypothetical protein